MLTGGQVADCTAAAALLEGVPANLMVHGDKGYDSNAVRHQIEVQGCVPNIPPKSNRKWKNCFSPYLYRGRNAIERMFGRLKDFRRIATRYDRLACNYLAAVQIAAIICYWLRVRSLTLILFIGATQKAVNYILHHRGDMAFSMENQGIFALW